MRKLGEDLRGRQKEKVLRLWGELIMEVELYFAAWCREGGGTKGQAIGCAFKRLQEKREFFKKYC